MTRILRPALVATLWFSLLTGVAYPLLVTGLAQALFPWQANGSLLERHGQVIGSALIAQSFTAPGDFWPRPSAVQYDAANSGGSNLGSDSRKLLADIRARTAALRAANPDAPGPVPEALVTTSASGLDPDLPPSAALWQVPRVAGARGLPPQTVTAMVNRLTQPRTFGLLGEPRVNVLALNRALDALSPSPKAVESGKR
jgi:K+-transporting ATPase, C subunit